MKRYILKRSLLIIPVLFGITVITFLIMHLTPGSYTSVNMQMDIRTSPDSIERLKSLYGLDRPVHIQYMGWLRRVVMLDFGQSFIDNRSVMKKIGERLPATILLNICALAVIYLFSFIIGIYAALKRNGPFDKAATIGTFAGYSIPDFWLALLLMMFFGVHLGILPVSGMVSVNHENMNFFERMGDIMKHLILPVFVLAFTGLASLTRYVKSGMVETLSQPFIRAAYAKGLPEKKIIFRNALKNSMLPVITILGMTLPGIIGGSFIFEVIFSWPGMGRLIYESIMGFDYPVVMGGITIAAFLTITGNLLADIAYAYVDPRIRYK
ncbi:MAG: ABC transporter permease [Candidatus Goldiibacteriota bacterium]